MFVKKKCDICGKSSFDVLYKKNFLNIKNEEVFWSHYKKEKKKYNFQIVRCKNCNHVYSNPVFNLKNLKKLYANSHFDNTWEEKKENIEKNYFYYFEIIKNYLDKKNQILEIGSDIGLLSNILLKNNFKKLTCIEPNKSSYIQSVKKFKKKKIKIINDFYGEKKILKKKYDSIILIHVLDHIHDTNKFFKNLKNNLKRGGTIFIVVHDINSFMSKILKSKFPPINVQHINFFSEDSLSKYLKIKNFQVKEIRKTYNYYSLMHYVKSSPLNFSLLTNFLKFMKIEKLPLKLKLGNFMIIAQKN